MCRSIIAGTLALPGGLSSLLEGPIPDEVFLGLGGNSSIGPALGVWDGFLNVVVGTCQDEGLIFRNGFD